jgi:hypothetical protein
MQKAVIVRACYDDSGDWQEYGIDEINDLLKDDWKVVSFCVIHTSYKYLYDFRRFLA